MTPEQSHVSAQEAREQLRRSAEQRLDRRADRRVHAVATAVFGLGVGVYSAAQNLATSWIAHSLLTAAFFIVVIGTGTWVERIARTVPRRSRLWSRVGLGASFLLSLLLVRPWLNLAAQAEPNAWPTVLAASVVIAVPSLVAAAAITRGKR